MFSLERFTRAVTLLEAEGLDWLAYARAADGPADDVVRAPQGVLLMLARGAGFASRTRFQGADSTDAFDERARSLVLPFIEGELSEYDTAARLVYPTVETKVNLMAWLRAAKAQYESRLGIGIRPDCGTWFAVRAAVVADLPSAAEDWLRARFPALDQSAPSPCSGCAAAPCVSACPARAVGTSFDLLKCVDQRLTLDSSCAAQCSARRVCPVGEAFRYPDAQVGYHYRVSLRMLQSWRSGH